jgi:pilus assembly protein CpaC
MISNYSTIASPENRVSYFFVSILLGFFAAFSFGEAAHAKGGYGGIFVPLNRAELIVTNADIGQIIVATPEIADVYAHGLRKVSIIGKKLGRTNIRIFDKQNNVIRAFDVDVGYDLPSIRRALWQFLKDEQITVDMVSTNLALSGDVSSPAAAEKAVRIVEQYMDTGTGSSAESAGAGAAASSGTLPTHKVLNLMKVISGQQVMLRVRVGEVRRAAVKQLGASTRMLYDFGNAAADIGTLGMAAIGGAGSGSLPLTGFSSTGTPSISGGVAYQAGKLGLAGLIEALESDGLFKTLAEPNLVAMSGEEAEFLAGGEFPVPVAQASTGGGSTNTVEFKPYGVAVKFIPFVITENRIRITVQPEVSEIDRSESTSGNGLSIPGITTRRAKTTVELAPGESFMIAGLLSDRTNTNISEVPGIAEVPILSALFRSNAFQRNETELVIAVTPYIVDPLKSTDVRLPTDDFRPASTMERIFYGALGTLSGNADRISQNPSLEGPVGFMMD